MRDLCVLFAGNSGLGVQEHESKIRSSTAAEGTEATTRGAKRARGSVYQDGSEINSVRRECVDLHALLAWIHRSH